MRFDSYHPTINFIYFAGVMTCTVGFNHPAFLAVSFVSSFAYSIKLRGRRAAAFNSILFLLSALYALWYAYYNHFGVTNLRQNFIGNQITLEALVYGWVIGITAASIMMWFSCLHAVVSTDKLIYLFGRILPKLSLFISILLRTVPRVRDMRRKDRHGAEGHRPRRQSRLPFQAAHKCAADGLHTPYVDA